MKKEELIMFICSDVNDELREEGLSRGYANGYVAIPPKHPFYGKDVCDDCFCSVKVHGGVTYSGYAYDMRVPIWQVEHGEYLQRTASVPEDYWVIGFDTIHYDDTLDNWNREAVIKETFKMKCQLDLLWRKRDIEKERALRNLQGTIINICMNIVYCSRRTKDEDELDTMQDVYEKLFPIIDEDIQERDIYKVLAEAFTMCVKYTNDTGKGAGHPIYEMISRIEQAQGFYRAALESIEDLTR